ncbi:uncharacterized protein [Asterias amurensis]|uniref:uncharacterized protein n=1 Tax=Asterias amurensis TaxID=7602 RepID=UPI003AB7AFA9
MAEKSGGRGGTGQRGKYFDLRVKLFTNEVFPVRDVYNEMKVRALKARMEFVTGVPSHLQRLTYLDGADMMDDSDIKHHDIVPGAVINLDVWYTWKTLIQAAADGETDTLLKLGVTKDSKYNTPNSEAMNERSKATWLAERAFVALCIASHRGHVVLVQKLIDGGSDVHDKTPNGRTALHITAAQGKNNAVEVLLNNGATIEDPDNEGKSALVLAGLWGHKSCERQIFLFQWQQRAAKQKPISDSGQLLAHQMYDSKLKTWLTGPEAQLYYSQILPPGEFSGTGLSAPRRSISPRPSSAPLERGVDETIRNGKLMEGNRGTQVSLGTESLKSLRIADSKKTSPSKGRYASPFQEAKSKASGDKKSYDDWLAQKKAKERRQAESKRKVIQQEKIKVEDEQRAVQEKEKSYETWLKEQKAAAKGKGKGGPALQSRSPERGVVTPDDKGLDLMKIRKEMDILHPVQVHH